MPGSTSIPSTHADARPQVYFATTRWTLVLAAGRGEIGGQAGQQALEQLCQTYWYPLYAYVRRRGFTPEDAEDLTQEFFRVLLAQDSLRMADREKGRFRSFLLAALKNFLANEWDRAHAQKRGGGLAKVSIDTSLAEQRFLGEPFVESAPEKIYDRGWALALLSRTMSRLREEFSMAGKLADFEHLKGCLTAERGELAYARLAAEAGMSEGAARVAVHRLRRRFREVFRGEIAHTVASPAEVDDELRYLMQVLAG